MPDPIDLHVGGRLRLARKAAGLSQSRVAKALGISFQQVQKYENGISRLGAGRLYRVARLFNVSVGFFFRDIPVEIVGTAVQGDSMPHKDDLEGLNVGAHGQNEEVMRLVATFLQITDLKLRTELISFITSLQQSLGTKRPSAS